MVRIRFVTGHWKVSLYIFVPFMVLILTTSTFLNMDIHVPEQGHTDKCTCRNRVFFCWWIIAKKTDISLFDANFGRYPFDITYHVKMTTLLTHCLKKYTYIIEYIINIMSGLGTRSTYSSSNIRHRVSSSSVITEHQAPFAAYVL